MELVGADSDLSPKTKLTTIVKTSRSVDHDHRRVDPGCKSPSGLNVLGHDRVGMF